jgi:hypothetical protein
LSDAIDELSRLRDEKRYSYGHTSDESDHSIDTLMHHAACALHNELASLEKDRASLPSPDDWLNAAERLVPDRLYSFLQCVLYGTPDDGLHGSVNESSHRAVLSIAQDMIYTASNGSVKPPKHIGLAVSLHHLTGSKQTIKILNRLGHSINYDDIKRLDTTFAQEQRDKAKRAAVFIPDNIKPNVFVQAAADNNDLCEETLDGKNTTHATTLVVYQKLLPGDTHEDDQNEEPFVLSRKRSLDEETTKEGANFVVSGTARCDTAPREDS